MWRFKFKGKIGEKFDKLDNNVKQQIKKYLNRVIDSGLPRSFGKALTGNKKGLWRYRVGDYRIICDIQDKEIIILIIDIDHRSEVYK